MEQRSEFTVAGWFAIAAAIVTLPMLVTGIIVDVVARAAPELAPLFFIVYSVTVVCHTLFSVYAFVRFRSLLNQRHGFHDVDGLVTAIVTGVVLFTVFMIPAKAVGVMTPPDRAVLFIVIAVMLCFAILMSALSVIFAVRLLRLQSDLNGFLKPYVWVTIVAAACFAMFITAPLGLLLDAAGNIILGLILLKPENEQIPDFV